MKFRTEVHIPVSDRKILPDEKIFSIGSCFATEMHERFSRGQLQSFANPFGTLYNPFSINVAVKRMHGSQYYTQDDLIAYQNEYISLDHYTGFNSDYAHLTLEKINTALEDGNRFLQDAGWVIVTYGSAFIYEFLPKKKLAANCHKIPSKFFNKRLLSHLELTDAIYETVSLLKDIARSDVRLLFTVSPVRHIRDGIVENNHSKSLIFSALHEILPQFDNCFYLPVYEIMMDELRDYRFYKEDMIHPTPQAVNYIFEKFGNAYFAEETMDFIEENFKILQALAHIPADKNSQAHQVFLKKINERIAAQQEKVKFPIFGGK